jgi:hypothetical protein
MDIKNALAKIIFFDVSQDLSNLTANEQEALRHCVRAAEIMTDIYLIQMDPRNPERRAALAARTDEEGSELLRYFDVNGGPWDGFNKDEPFIAGVGAKPKAATFYPADMTEKEWDEWLAAHPGDREKFESRSTIIKRSADGGLVAVPYGEEYKSMLEKASRELTAAAALLPDGTLKKFLTLRAAAFLSNDYWESDVAWVDTDGTPFEVTIGPYEAYADGLFGMKATFEAFVALPDEAATAEMRKFAAALPEFDAALAARLGYKAKNNATPMVFARDVVRGGEAAFGRQFVAYNLPNDRKIHEVKGSKKVFSKTMMDAKFSMLTRPIAERLLSPDALKKCGQRHRTLFVLGHELAHGIGPGVRDVDGREVSFEILLRDLHPMLEEAKADMLGVALLDHFYKKGLLTHEELEGAVISEVASLTAGWRASYTEAHSAGSLIEYNWLIHSGAVRYDEATGFFEIDPEKTLAAMIALGEEFVKVQLESDYAKAAAFIKQWGFIAPEVPGLVARFTDLPLELHPAYRT